jgi:hypothetical protein
MNHNQKEEMRSWRRDFTNHRYNAKGRKADFFLSFEDWMKLWLDSGHAHKRGRGKGKYCMARFGDQGPYTVGNVRITSMEDNLIDQWKRPETLKKVQEALIGNAYAKGYKHTDESRFKMRRSSAVAKPVVCVNDGRQFISIKEAANFYGIKRHNIYGFLCGETKATSKTLKGLLFKYA